MISGMNYRALFTESEGRSLKGLTGELHDLLATIPAPNPGYREKLRGQLMAAARDERFYRAGVPRQLVLAMAVVLSVLISVVGFVAWRSLAERANRV